MQDDSYDLLWTCHDTVSGKHWQAPRHWHLQSASLDFGGECTSLNQNAFQDTAHSAHRPSTSSMTTHALRYEAFQARADTIPTKATRSFGPWRPFGDRGPPRMQTDRR